MSRVINAVMMKVQQNEGVEIRQGFQPCRAPISFGIIPTGRIFLYFLTRSYLTCTLLENSGETSTLCFEREYS